MPHHVKFGDLESTYKNKPFKITTNLDRMLEYCLGCKVSELNGQLAVLCFPRLAEAAATILNPRFADEFDKMLPENGYGTVDDAQEFLLTMMVRASKYSDQIITIETKDGGTIVKTVN